MATTVGLNMKMTASIAKFQSSMDKVEQKLKAIEHSGKQTASGMKLLAGIEVGKLLVGGLTKVAGLARSAASSALALAADAAATSDAIGKLATSTGMAIPELQVFTQLAAYGGVSSTQFGDALQKMSRGLGEAANGTGTAKRGLEQLGLSVDDLLKMSPSQQFMKIAAAIDGIEDPAKRSAIAADIFGRSGTKLIPMFENIEENARKTTGEMESLAQVLSTEQVRNIEAMNDSFDTVKKTVMGVVAQVVGHLAPAVVEANNKLLEFVKNFQFKGATGGQAFVGFVTEAFIKAAKILADWADAFILALTKAFDQIGQIFDRLSDFLAKYLGMDRYASPGANEADERILAIDAEFARLQRHIDKYDLVLSQGLMTEEKHQDKVGSLVRRQQLLWDQRVDAEAQILRSEQAYYEGKKSSVTGMTSIRSAVDKIADGLTTKITPAIDTVPSRLKVMTEAFQKASPVVGNFEKAIPGAISKVMDFGTNLVSSARDFGTKLVERADVADKLYNQFQGLVDAGLGTSDELRQLTAVASGTGAAADAAKARLNMLAGSAEMLTSTQERLANKMMSPIERWADQRQNFLEAMGFNPFYVEEQKRLWLAKQKEAVDAQIEEAKKAYIGFKETLGESLGILGEDGSLEIPEPIDPREAINATTEAVGEVVTELKNVWSNIMVAVVG